MAKCCRITVVYKEKTYVMEHKLTEDACEASLRYYFLYDKTGNMEPSNERAAKMFHDICGIEESVEEVIKHGFSVQNVTKTKCGEWMGATRWVK